MTFDPTRCARPCIDNRLHFSLARAHRVVFPVDQGHLRIKHYYGTSANAVKTQIWIAVCVFLMVAILDKKLKLPGTLHKNLQFLSVHPFEKAPLHEILTKNDYNAMISARCKQVLLGDL